MPQSPSQGFIKFAEIPAAETSGEIAMPDMAAPESIGHGQAMGNLKVFQMLKDLAGWISEHPVEAGAMAGATAAVPLTGGASLLPSMAAAGLGGAGGAGFGMLAGAATGSGDVPTTAGGVLKGMGTQGAIMGLTEGLGGLATTAVSKGAEGVYRGMLKPSLSAVNRSQAAEIVRTALDEAIPISKAGAGKAQRIISDLNGQVTQMLQNARGDVDLTQIAQRVRRFAERKYFKPGAADASYEAAMRVADSIDQHAAITSPWVSAQEAQGVKTTLYDRATDAAYGDGAVSAERLAAKEGGRAAREAIEAAVEGATPEERAFAQLQARTRGQPSLGKINAREGRLIETRDAVSRAADRDANQAFNPKGASNMLSAAVGAEEGYRRDPASGIVMGLATRGLLSPAVASRAAILASKLARETGMAATQAARVAIQRTMEGSQ